MTGPGTSGTEHLVAPRRAQREHRDAEAQATDFAEPTNGHGEPPVSSTLVASSAASVSCSNGFNAGTHSYRSATIGSSCEAFRAG